MISELVDFYRTALRPRWREFVDAAFWIAVIVAAVSLLRPELEADQGAALAEGLLTYASVVVGYSITALSLILAFPTSDFVDLLVRTNLGKGKGPPKNAYRTLTLIFTWLAFSHAVLLVTLFAGLRGATILHWSRPVTIGYHTATTFVVAYCFCRFVASIFTLWQIGEVYASERLKPKKTQ